MKKYVFFLIIVLLFSWEAQAEFTAHNLLQSCEDVTRIACVQYFGGVQDTLKAVDNSLCYPAKIEPDAFIRSIIKYIDQNPKMLHLNAAEAVMIASNEIYPCERDLHPHRF